LSPLTGAKMEIDKRNSNKINRKKFFSSLGTGVISYFIFKSIPFAFISKKEKDRKVIIEINPDAVSRTKIGEKNV
jgi:hypothetical protein